MKTKLKNIWSRGWFLIPIILMVAMTALGLDVLIQRSRFKAVMFDMAYSIAYAEENYTTVAVTDGGDRVLLDPYNMDCVYNMILTAKYAGRGRKAAPADSCIVIDFGNDTELKIYTGSDGKVYMDYAGSKSSGCYRLGRYATYGDLVRLCSPEGTGHPNKVIGGSGDPAVQP